MPTDTGTTPDPMDVEKVPNLYDYNLLPTICSTISAPMGENLFSNGSCDQG